MSREVVVVSAVRTAIGTYGGSLKDMAPTELAALVVREVLSRAQWKARMSAMWCLVTWSIPSPKTCTCRAWPPSTAAAPKVCRPSTSTACAAQACRPLCRPASRSMLGDADIAIGGGAENMSRAPYASLNMRWGARMGDTKMVDMMVGALHDPFHAIHMGLTAENIAAKWGISRDDQDALAVESHNRAQRAVEAGYFKSQIMPVMLKSRKGDVAFEADEHFRPNCSMAELAKLKPAFMKEGGTVTAGNASGINDAAAAVVLMEAATAKARGLKPLARMVAYAHAGVDPKYMGIGPVPASQAALKKAGLTVQDLDVIEANEAFAAQACAVSRDLGLDPAKVNPNGSGISLGHPIGATGALDHRQGTVRAGAYWRALRAGHHVHWWRSGYCRHL
jgi:acetyl-CoA C-acetyltransferase